MLPHRHGDRLFRFLSIGSVTVLALLLTGCAFLLNNIITGARSKEYVFLVYLQGLPRSALVLMTKDGERLPLEKVRMLDVAFEVNLSGAGTTVPYAVREVSRLFKSPDRELRFVSIDEKINLSVSGSLLLRFATETTVLPVEIREEFNASINDVPHGTHYVLIKFLDNAASPTALVEVVPRASAFRFNVTDQNEGFVDTYDGPNRYVFFTSKGADQRPNFVFVGKRNEFYSFVNQAGVLKQAFSTEPDKEETTISF